jgi:hypothetical protein
MILENINKTLIGAKILVNYDLERYGVFNYPTLTNGELINALKPIDYKAISKGNLEEQIVKRVIKIKYPEIIINQIIIQKNAKG